MKHKLTVLAISIFCLNLKVYSLDLSKDEIDFFNVGQGHAVLINKARTVNSSYVPLLIDAGSSSHPLEQGENFEYTKPIIHREKTPKKEKNKYNWKMEAISLSSSKISKRILEFWQSSNNGHLYGGQFQLNIIASHPDADHHNIIPVILNELISRQALSHYTFQVSFFLGGKKSDQSDAFLRNFPLNNVTYSEEILTNKKGGICLPENLGFLKSSECITHMFCPIGIESDSNRWSIITRIQINGISAMLCGDANTMVKSQMLEAMNALLLPWKQLESNILLLPHHGAENTSHPGWDCAVNPQALVIGAAPNEGYHHPRGDTIFSFLNLLEGKGRLWSYKVRQHAIQYYSPFDCQQQIQRSFLNHGERLFDSVPNTAIERNITQTDGQWYLAWNDLPLYTLWTTGTLFFSQDVKLPLFTEAPHGLMNYVAVPDPRYLLSPSIRGKILPLTHTEEGMSQQISQSLKIQFRINEVILQEVENIFARETLLIGDAHDRELYLHLICEIFSEKNIIHYTSYFFPWFREAIVNNNKLLPLADIRLREAVKTLMFRAIPSNIEKYNGPLKHLYEDLEIVGTLFAGMLDHSALILKTFTKSIHSLEQLGSYIRTFGDIRYCGPLVEDIDILCPFGFPEWIQLARLVGFFREAIIEPLGEAISIMDAMDITVPRTQGKNFKVIAKELIEYCSQVEAKEQATSPSEDLAEYLQNLSLNERQTMLYQNIKRKHLELLEGYFPSNLDAFLS